MSRDDGRARAAVLGSIRQSLGRAGLSADARRELDERMKAPRANLVPARAQLPRREQLELFVAMAEQVSCTVERVTAAAVPGAVSDYLRHHNLPSEVALAPDPWLKELPWAGQPMLKLTWGRPDPGHQVGITPAYAGIAETGTLAMQSGPDHPTTLNFLPDHHVVALRASQVVGTYEEVWARLRQDRARGDGFDLPRTLNLITGPSRTGDIELTIHLGAHGPRRLHILLIDDEAGEAGGE